MKAIVFTALIAACSCAKLDRTYLPPSANTAGGSSDILQTPVSRTNQGLGGLPVGSYVNDAQGIVVDAAVGTRASNPQQSGLGLPRATYGSSDSKVGEAAFRDKHLQGGPSFIPQGFIQDVARPERIQASRDRASNTVRFEANLNPQSYNYVYETDNGISASEDGVVVDGVKAKGGYSYTGDDGQVYTVTYTADEGGYKPQGAHLPTPPPIPVEILKSLEQNAKDEAAGLADDGSYDAKKYNAGGEYTESNSDNDSQSNKFTNRPGSVQTNFINQNAVRPNAQFGIGNTQQEVNVQGSENLPGFNGFNQQPSQIFGQNTPLNVNQASSSFGSANFKPNQGLQSNEYLPPKQQFFQQNVPSSINNADKQDSNTQSTTIPLSQQTLQSQDQSLTISSSRPSSYDTSISSVSGAGNSNAQKEISTPTPQFSTQQSGFGTINTIAPSQTLVPGRPNNNNNLSTGAFTQQGSLNSFGQHNTVQPTNQPSKELTTPFESSNSISTQGTSFTSTSFGQKPTTEIDGSKQELYEYNRPAQAGPTDAPISPNTQNVNYNQDKDGSFTQVLQTPNRVQDNKADKPLITPISQSRPTGSSFTASVSENQGSFGNTGFGNPSKPSSDIFSQAKPTDVSRFPTTGGPISNNQYTLAQTTPNSQTPIQNSFTNNLPSSSFFQPRPTIPSFSQTQAISQNQYTQPQGPDGSYYYDRPNKFNQQPIAAQPNQFFKPQRPEFNGQTSFVNRVQSVPTTAPSFTGSNTFQGTNNGLTQASASSFDTDAPTFPTNPGFSSNNQFGSQQITSQPGSAFAQAVVSTQLPSLSNQGQSTYDGEIYQYNKPESAVSSSSSNNEGSADFQPGTQSIPTVPTQTNQESFTSQNILKPELGQGQGEKEPFAGSLGSTILGSACCRGNQNVNKFGQNQFNSGPALQAKPQFFAGAEKFDTNRKPPSFDSTGYHY